MVNWKRVCRPKRLGGLGILHLGHFNTALRLRWQWHQRQTATKPWAGMQIPSTKIEQDLFRACTTVTIGNGTTTSFWHDKWLQAQAPKDLAPDLYKLAWHKNRTVAKALHNRKWMRGLRRMTTTTEIQQYVQLWSLLQTVQLNEEADKTAWRFNASGLYSVRSAYDM